MEKVTKSRQFVMALIQVTARHNKQDNLKRTESLVDTAVKLYKPKVVVLPEFFNTPLGTKDLSEWVEEEDKSETLEWLKGIAKKHEIDLIGGSIPILNNGKAYNTNFCIRKTGELALTFKKLHLFDIDIPGKITYLESEKLAPGQDFGVFETEYAKFGIGICYDIRFPEYSLLLRKEHNVDVLVYPAAFNTVTGPMHWELLGRSRAVDNHVHVALCSQARNLDDPTGYQAYGHSMVIDPFAVVQTTTGHEEDILATRVDLTRNEEIGEQIPIWKQKRWDLYNINSVKK
jgi:omega-amidase